MLCVDIKLILEVLEDQGSDLAMVNVPCKLTLLKENLTSFTSGLTRYKRSPATHVLVTMISPSERSKKPYAVPVSCIPYAGMPEKNARMIINSIVEEMHKKRMNVLGRCDLCVCVCECVCVQEYECVCVCVYAFACV